ncbi:MAG: alpha-amylase family protein [Lysobacterales bacterium]
MNTPLIRLLLLLVALLGARASSAEVMLHAFNWRYADVAAQASLIKAQGYASVLVSPPLRSEGNAWWARYQPQDFRLIDNPLGNTEDFRAMSEQLAAVGLRLYADIVINHMANEAGQRPDLNYPGSRVLAVYASSPAYFERQRLFGDLAVNLYSGNDFHEARCIQDYNNVFQVQNWRLCGGGGDPGLPDLGDGNTAVAGQRSYLRALKTLGVSGFRIDAAKHMTLKQLARIFTPDITDGMLIFGELITGGGVGNIEYERFLAPWLAQTGHSAYDFPLHAGLRQGFGFGGDLAILADPVRDGQALPDGRAITFTLTHDMPNNAGFRGLLLDPVDETLAYAYLLGRAGGIPMVYSDHNESGDGRWIDAYQRADLAAMIDFHNRSAGSDMRMLAAGSCFLLFRRGVIGVVGINKCGNAIDVDLDLSAEKLLGQRDYRDLLSGQLLRIDRPDFRVNLPPRSARMWMLQDNPLR